MHTHTPSSGMTCRALSLIPPPHQTSLLLPQASTPCHQHHHSPPTTPQALVRKYAADVQHGSIGGPLPPAYLDIEAPRPFSPPSASHPPSSTSCPCSLIHINSGEWDHCSNHSNSTNKSSTTTSSSGSSSTYEELISAVAQLAPFSAIRASALPIDSPIHYSDNDYDLYSIDGPFLFIQSHRLAPPSLPALRLISEKEQEERVPKAQRWNDLPPELILQVLGHLSHSNWNALSQCHMVCKTWRSVTSPLLFHTPRLNTLSSFRKLVHTIESSTKPILPFVRQLNLSNLPDEEKCDPAMGDLFSRLVVAKGPTKMTTLDLSLVRGISNLTLIRSVKHLVNLRALNLTGSGRSDLQITQFARHCPELRKVSCAWNDFVTDFAILELIKHCPNLQWLDLSGCWRLTDHGLQRLALQLPQQSLKSLDLSFCVNLSIKGLIPLLQKGHPTLSTINLMGCDDVEEDLTKVLDAFSGLRVNDPEFCGQFWLSS